MYQADQKAVIQEANITLVNIRAAEVQYFSDFFTNFATQCTLLAGFIAGAISQTPDLQSDVFGLWKSTYFIGSALCIAFAFHAMLICLFVAVFGQGLALRGPPGSMVKTVNGMIAEQRNAVALFIIAIGSYIVSEVAMYFIMMDLPWAWVCAVATILSTMYTYHVSLRIYNRFWWPGLNRPAYRETVDEGKILQELSPEFVHELYDRYGKEEVLRAYQTSMDEGQLSPDDPSGKQRGVLSRALSKLVNRKKKGDKEADKVNVDSIHSHTDPSPYDGGTIISESPYLQMNDYALPNIKPKVGEDDSASGIGDHSTLASALHNSQVLKAGYLTLYVGKNKGLRGLMTDPWQRRYVVMQGSLIFFYQNNVAYSEHPGRPINKRPIDLEGYTIVAGAREPPYNISLVPVDEEDVRRIWKFRCDTLAELNSWIQVFSTALKLTASGQEYGDLVSVIDGNAGSVV